MWGQNEDIFSTQDLETFTVDHYSQTPYLQSQSLYVLSNTFSRTELLRIMRTNGTYLILFLGRLLEKILHQNEGVNQGKGKYRVQERGKGKRTALLLGKGDPRTAAGLQAWGSPEEKAWSIPKSCGESSGLNSQHGKQSKGENRPLLEAAGGSLSREVVTA